MRLLLIRHADPDYERDSITEKGERETALLTERLAKERIDRVYCSPLGRAQATARPYLERSGLAAQTCEWLREFQGAIADPVTGEQRICWDLLPRHFTVLDGLYQPDKWLDTPPLNTASVRENTGMVYDGVDALLARHGYVRDGRLYRAEHANEDTLALFCHFGVICVILSRLFSTTPVLYWQHFAAPPSSVTVLHTEEREQGKAIFRCSAFGDTSHLYAGGEPLSFSARFCETYTRFDQRH